MPALQCWPLLHGLAARDSVVGTALPCSKLIVMGPANLHTSTPLNIQTISTCHKALPPRCQVSKRWTLPSPSLGCRAAERQSPTSDAWDVTSHAL